MSRDQAKPTPKRGKAAPAANPKLDALAAGKLAGTIQFDERGNAIWEMAKTSGAFTTEESAHPLKRLGNPTLSIAEDDGAGRGQLRANPLGTLKGYDPYESGELVKPRKKNAKKRDLRKLGEWLKSRRLAEKNKRDAQ